MWKVYFDLTSPSLMSLNFEINNFNVGVAKNSIQITIDNIQAINQNAAGTKALFAATCCINYLCWKYDVVLEINSRSLSFEEIDLGGKTINRTGDAPIGLRAAIMVGSSSQNPTTVRVKKSEAASYYRKGCLSTDCFDQFRNFYSAIENVSSQIYRRQSGEPEKIELERALEACFGTKLQSLEDVAKAEPAFNTRETIISEVTRILYKANQCQLNHSEVYKDKKIVFNLEDEMEVTNALPLVKFVAKALLEYKESPF